ncbi:hypothetical protein KP509_10G009400 [Ceratopteris richardii]|uniref:Uncharacterized protein n=1 Tax=Ceratopteris richardii TaxID=49495 RepID=A0A8T2TYA8_CERRI|nr:hypothetical protein KP509_10G009400 [Ceratopteris richardii]
MAVFKAPSVSFPSPSSVGAISPAKRAVRVELPKSNLLLLQSQESFLAKQVPGQRCRVIVQAQYSDKRSGAGDFLAGFVFGGVIAGALGYLFAPQINKLVSTIEREFDESRGFYSDDDDEALVRTRRNLNEKIAQLNAAIDNVSAQLKADNKLEDKVESPVTEFESAV